MSIASPVGPVLHINPFWRHKQFFTLAFAQPRASCSKRKAMIVLVILTHRCRWTQSDRPPGMPNWWLLMKLFNQRATTAWVNATCEFSTYNKFSDEEAIRCQKCNFFIRYCWRFTRCIPKSRPATLWQGCLLPLQPCGSVDSTLIRTFGRIAQSAVDAPTHWHTFGAGR